MIVLGIESTCDETAIAVVKDGYEILSNIVHSQANFHAQFGGVYPEYASRMHEEVIVQTLSKALDDASISFDSIDLIAVANRPGLTGSIHVGLSLAKTLSITMNTPFVCVDHIESHIYSAFMEKGLSNIFPSLGVVISGGHTLIQLMNGIGDYTLVSTTIDDAIGEAFDKVAKMLQFPYPGGPHIEDAAKRGNSKTYSFSKGRVKKNTALFSLSGLKTQVHRCVEKANKPLSLDTKNNIAASFQKTVFDDIIDKISLALKKTCCTTIGFGGGVINNQTLRKKLDESFPNTTLLFPSAGLSLDNGAMIAGLGYHIYKKNGKSSLSEVPSPRSSLRNGFH